MKKSLILNKNIDTIWTFNYTDCIYEYGPSPMSYHKTPRGAYTAMRSFLETIYNEWRNDNILYGAGEVKYREKFGRSEMWYIRKIQLET